MNPYPDAGFLITLVVQTNGTEAANEILKQLSAPCTITLLHELQLRSLLAKMAASKDAAERQGAKGGLKAWQWYLDEELLSPAEMDWATSFSDAILFLKDRPDLWAPPLLVLHPILAIHNGSTEFLSFDPRSRKVAQSLGLRVLPEKL